MRIQRTGLLVLLPFCFAGAGIAQNTPRFELFVEGGGSLLNAGPAKGNVIFPCPTCALSQAVPISGSDSAAGRLFTGTRFRFTPHGAVEASYSFSTNHFDYRAGNTDASAIGYTRLDVISFNYVRYLSVRSRFQPFVTAGIGTNRFRGGPGYPWRYPFDVGSAPGGGVLYTVNFANPGNNGWQFAWNIGGGADFILPFHFALRVELRGYVSAQPIPLTGTSHNIVPTAGFVFRFK